MDALISHLQHAADVLSRELRPTMRCSTGMPDTIIPLFKKIAKVGWTCQPACWTSKWEAHSVDEVSRGDSAAPQSKAPIPLCRKSLIRSSAKCSVCQVRHDGF